MKWMKHHIQKNIYTKGTMGYLRLPGKVLKLQWKLKEKWRVLFRRRYYNACVVMVVSQKDGNQERMAINEVSEVKYRECVFLPLNGRIFAVFDFRYIQRIFFASFASFVTQENNIFT